VANFLKVFKVNALPATLEPSSLYLIPSSVPGELRIVITDKDALSSLSTPTQSSGSTDVHFFNDRLILKPVIEASPTDASTVFLQNNDFVGSRSVFISPEGRSSFKIQASFDDRHVFWIKPIVNNSASPHVLGLPNPTIIGTRTARTINFSSSHLSYPRLGIVSSAAAGSLSGLRISTLFLSVGVLGKGGFFLSTEFMFSDTSNVAGARAFIGLTTTTAAPTNVEPSTLLNVIGVASLSTSANLVIVSGNGTAPNSVIDLGIGFPANALSQNLYKVCFNSDPVEGGVHYYVKRIGTGNVAEGYIPSGSIPGQGVGLTFSSWRTNNSTATAVGLDVGVTYIEVNKRSI